MREQALGDAGKYVAARMMLEDLALRGYNVPQVFDNPEAFIQIMEDAGIIICSFVVLLKELCAQYFLDPVEYENLENGTSNQANFVVRARHGHVQRIAVAETKQKATQLAAEQIYTYLHNSVSGARNFDEVEAMVRAYTRARAEVAEARAARERREEELQMEAAQQATELKKNKNLAVQATVRLEQEDSAILDNDPNATGPEPQNAQGGTGLDITYIKDIMKRLEL